MIPTFMGDAGFDASHLLDWRKAEAKLGIVNAAAKAKARDKVAPSPTHPLPHLHPLVK